ncbi:MAG: hypothetical protein WCA10_09210 [Terracidiphilus sp.]
MSTNTFSTSQASLDWGTPTDVQRQFAAAMSDLFCLALLLTAQADRAEECIIRSIRECMTSARVRSEELPAWVRNSVIRNGVAIVDESKGESHWHKEDQAIPLLPAASQGSVYTADYSAGILELSSFDRLVYVICVLERYSSRHCALLLRSSRERVREARVAAVAHIAEFESRWREWPTDVSNGARLPESEVVPSCGSLLD